VQDGYSIHIDLPGVSKKEVEIEIVDDKLYVRGHHMGREGFPAVAAHDVSHPVRRFRKIISLDNLEGDLDFKGMKATLNNGLMEIFIPFKKQSEGLVIPVC
jgi:HSP20 family molecular chaperone IbpA